MKSLELYSCLPLLVRLQPSKIEPEAAIFAITDLKTTFVYVPRTPKGFRICVEMLKLVETADNATLEWHRGMPFLKRFC